MDNENKNQDELNANDVRGADDSGNFNPKAVSNASSGSGDEINFHFFQLTKFSFVVYRLQAGGAAEREPLLVQALPQARHTF